MKKFTALLMALIMMTGCTSAAFAADNSADVYVSIANKGELVVAYEQISVSDEDSDGKITINDTLIAAHDEFYKDGTSGYESKVVPPYDGLSLTKLWGNTNSGSFGYYVNDASAWSLSDEVKNGSFLAETNGDEHNLIPDEESWIEDAKSDMEEYLELNGVYIRQ